MKKLFLTICVAALAATTASAQLAVSAGFLNRAEKTEFNTETKSVDLNGYYAGVSYTIGLPAGFSITPGVYYNATTNSSVDSSDYSSLYTLVGGDATLKEQFLSVPIDLAFSFGVKNLAKVFIFAGPVFEYALGSDFEVSVASATETYDRLKDGDYKNYNLLAGGGIGAEILETIRVVAGYNYGLMDTLDSDAATVKSNQLYFGVSYIF